MTTAYDEKYLNDAIRNLGEASDYAVNSCGLEMDAFMDLFIASGFAEQFGKGNPKVVAGFSGTELVMEVLEKAGLKRTLPEPQIAYDCSAEYWCGWILAYYQWATARSFRDIHEALSMKEIYKMYETLHEASEDKFVDTANEIIARKKTSTALQRQRKKCGYSQRELAEKAGVNLRTLQQYELGAKDIKKASAAAVLSIANVLGCRVEDLME